MKIDYRYPIIYIYADKGSWFWKAIGATERVLATSGAYETRYYAREAAKRFMEIAQYAQVVDTDPKDCSWCGMRTTTGTLHERCADAKKRTLNESPLA